MSKKFKQQDYTAYKKLADRWRKPKGMQGKMRIKKRGSGPMPRIGCRTKKEDRINIAIARNIQDLEAIQGSMRIAAGVGARKTLEIAEKAKKLGIKILNMKKIRRAEKLTSAIEAKKGEKKAAATGKEKTAEKVEETKTTSEAPKENKTVVEG